MMSLFLANEPATGGGLSIILIFVAVIAIMYFLMIRPEKKKQKKVEAMRDALKVGDNITTIGGIVGDVVSIKDGKDGKIVIETSADRVRMELEKWSDSPRTTPPQQLPEKPPSRAEKQPKSGKGEEKQVNSINTQNAKHFAC
ncbi:MAG: preprotein translocase subunit YajC [Oscillospiraceae bacterium]